MKTTSDERREVAEKLRELAHDNQGVLGFARMQHVMDEGTRILGTVGLPDCAHVITRYADLIDPTSRAIYKGRQDKYTVCYGCSVCNFGWFENVHDMPYSYCPHCGARLVDKEHLFGGD